jgi:glutathione peroxidase-family protein
MTLKSIYDIELSSAEGKDNFLQQFKGKAGLIVNTTVGCGNANQMEILQWLQDRYGGDDFQIIAIPTNDYCGPGITHGKWSEGITCGADSQNYGRDVYGTTFQFSEMVASNPNDLVASTLGVEPGHNGLGQPNKTPHEMYQQIAYQMLRLQEIYGNLPTHDFYSWWLNLGFYGGVQMGGNFEKYLVDKDGYVYKHFQCTVLNYDSEKTVKEMAEKEGRFIGIGMGRSEKIFLEEYNYVCGEIEKLISGEKSALNPSHKKVSELV